MYYFDDGWSIHTWINGSQKHCTTGPASIIFDPNGKKGAKREAEKRDEKPDP